MSLTVNVYTNNGYIHIPAGDSRHKQGEEIQNLAQLWGAAVIQELGLELLPSLAEHDLTVNGPNLLVLEVEVKTILNYIDFIAQATHYSIQDIERHCRHILRAVATARSVNGGVIIW